MANGTVLELSTLPARHPDVGTALHHAYAPATIVRLSVDPTPQQGTLSREVEVNWLRRPGRGPVERVRRRIGWSNEGEGLRRVCEELPITKNDQDLTEEAAVGVAALLIHDLEGGVLQKVLPIGSGGDYLLRVSGMDSFIQLEVSGLREDHTGSASASRLRQKTEQVLTQARVGFVSVTTFSHGPHAVVHGYQHFVRKKRRRSRKKPGAGRKGGKK
jgi:hypothetical protein